MARKTSQPPLPERNEIIVQRPMEDIMHDSMIPYSEYVILERALPRVEDGLKPVQRRILYTMHELGLTPDKPHRKCARIVGDCLGKFHPHGDTSVYDALARLAQPFALRGMLVNGHGNFGSIDGDSPAAMRYTEARMTSLAMEMLRDIEKNTVSFSLNFDDTQKEPDMLPGRYPNLLVNGASGIAVGLATNIPPHNLREAVKAVIAQMDNPDITVEELMQHMPAPDFPTGGILLCDEELKNAYATGRGKLQVRAKVSVEDGSAGRKLLVITEVPYQVPKAAMLEKILRLSEEKKGILSGIYDIRDESDRTGLRAVIELKRDTDPQKVLNYLYKYSDLQVTFGVNMVAIAGGKPVLMGIKEIIRHYIDHQKNVVTRRTQFELEQAQARAHILEGLIIAVDNLDEVIRIIRSSKNPKEARASLMSAFSLTEIQAQAILDMRLQRLTNLEIVALRNEYAALEKLINKLMGILKSEKKLIAVIKNELTEVSEKYGDDRRTTLAYDISRDIVIEKEAAPSDETVILMTSNGFLKRMTPKAYDKTASDIPEGDEVRVIRSMTDHKLLFFTDTGFSCSANVTQIPECRMKDRGMPLSGLLAGLEKVEKIIEVLTLPPTEWTGDLMFVTQNGIVKRTELSEYSVRKARVAAINLKNDDKVISLFRMTENTESLLMVSESGMAIHFPVGDIAAIGRTAAGVKGISLAEGDHLIAAHIGSFEGELLLMSDLGYAKRCLMVDFELQARGGKGTKCFTLLKNGTNGSRLIYSDIVREPHKLLIRQMNGEKTELDTDTVRIEMKSGKGTPYIFVLLGNDITSITKA